MKKLLYMVSLLILGFSVALLGVSPLAHATTPTISGVSGTVSTGQTLTITGANMVNENTANWDTFFTTHPTAYGFEGSSPGTAGQCDGDCYCNFGPCGGSYDASVKIMGNKSIKFHIEGASSNCPLGYLDSYNAINPVLSNGDQGDLWIRFYARWNLIGGTWPSSAIKMFGTLGSPSTPRLALQPYHSGKITTTTMLALYDEASHNVNIPDISGGQIQNNRWYLFEFHWKTTSPQSYQAWMDGVQIVNATFTRASTVDYLLFGILNLCETSSSFSIDHWWDGFTVSSSRIYPASTIEIGNSSNYASATKNYQEPIYLSDGSIQIKAYLSGLGSGPYYIWVTNNRQEMSAAYALSGGGGGDTTPPSVSMTAPSQGQTVSGTVMLSANTSDNVSVAGVQFKIDGLNFGTEDTASPYSISWDTTTASNGTHTITAVARDTSGNLTTSNPISVTVNNVTGDTTPPSVLTGDTTPPSVSITAPVYGQTVSGTVTISANASDNVAVGGVQFKIDGSNLGAEDTTNAYAISCDTTTLSNGVHAITAVVRDTSGNLTTSNPVSVTVNNTIVIPPATVLFEEDFEDTNFPSRGWYDGTYNSNAITTSQHYTGTHAYECHFTSSATHCSGGDPRRMLFTATDSIYISYWMKLSSNWIGSGQSYHPHIIYLLTDQNGVWDGLAITNTTAYLELNGVKPRIGLQDGANINMSYLNQNLCATNENRAVNGCNGTCDTDTWDTAAGCYDLTGNGDYTNGKAYTANAPLTTTWHHIEAYMKMNSISGGKGQKDGLMQMWVDGSQVMNFTDIIYRTNQHPTMKWNQFIMAPYNIGDGSGSPIDQYFWFDNLTVATSATSRPGTDVAPEAPVVTNIQ